MLSFDLNRDEAVTTEEEIDGRRLDGETFEDRLQTKRGGGLAESSRKRKGERDFSQRYFTARRLKTREATLQLRTLCTDSETERRQASFSPVELHYTHYGV